MDSSPHDPESRKKTRSKSGRKRSPSSRTPGKGAARLRRAVDALLSDQCDQLAQALVDKTLAGNMISARILLALTDAKTPLEKPKKKRHGGLTAVERILLEPTRLEPIEQDSPDDEDTDDTPSDTSAPNSNPNEFQS